MVNPFSYFSIQPDPQELYNKGRDMCYPVCGMVYKKEPLLLIGKSSPRGSGSGFLLSLSWRSFTIYLMPYNQKVILMKYRGNHIELKGSLLNEYSSTTILLDYSFYVNRIYTI